MEVAFAGPDALVHVEKEDQFILLCRKHHKAVETMATRKGGRR